MEIIKTNESRTNDGNKYLEFYLEKLIKKFEYILK